MTVAGPQLDVGRRPVPPDTVRSEVGVVGTGIRGRHAGLLALWALSLALRVAFFQGMDVRETLRADGFRYGVLAWSLANRGAYSEAREPPLVPHTRWPPGYPALLAPFYVGRDLASGASAALPVQVALGSLLPLLVVALGRRLLLPPPLAWIAGALAACDPAMATTPAFLTTECVFTLLLAAALLALTKLRDAPTAGRGAAVGALLGAVALVRSSATGLPFLGAAWLAASGPGDARTRRRAALALVGVASLGLVGWEVRHRIALAHGGDPASYFARPLAEGIYPGLVYGNSARGYAMEADPRFPEFSTSIRATLAEAWRLARADPWTHLRWNLVGRWLTLWEFGMIQDPPIHIYPVARGLFRPAAINPAGTDEPLAVFYRVFRALYYAVVVPAVLFGAGLLVVRRWRGAPVGPPGRVLVYGLLGYHVALHGILVPEPRFMLPVRPLLYLLALGTLAEVPAWVPGLRRVGARVGARFAAAGPVPWLLLVAVVAAYANSLPVGFRLDDWHVLRDNPWIRSLAHVPRFFVDADTTSVLRENRDLRPLVMTSFALNWAISGAAPWSWHVLNLLLHWGVAVLVFRIVRDHLWLGETRVAVAAAAALLVAVHPLGTQAVVYLSARSALLATLGYLAAFDAAARGRWGLALGAFAAALLAKAVAATFPVVLLAWYVCAPERRRIPWLALLAFVALDVVAGAYRWALVPAHAVASTSEVGVTPWRYCMTGWSAYLHYLRLFVWPDALAIDRKNFPIVEAFTDRQAWASLLALGGLAVAAAAAHRRRRAVGFAAVWFLVTLAAESTFFPLAEAVNDHRPYLALLGLATIGAVALSDASAAVARRVAAPPGWLFAVVVGALASTLGSATVIRNTTWRDDYTLWLDATRKAPANARAWLNAGVAAMDDGRLGEARRLMERARTLAPCYAYVHVNLSVLAAREGRPAAALAAAEEAVRCAPTLALGHRYHGDALDRVGRPDEALAAYREAVRLDPMLADAWTKQGRLLEAKEAWAAAAAAYDRGSAVAPDSAEPAMLSALLHHHRLGDLDGAVARYREVLRRMPSHYGAHYQLAVALLRRGETREAGPVWAGFVRLARAIGDESAIAGAPADLRALAR